jgi:hypothetical protein
LVKLSQQIQKEREEMERKKKVEEERKRRWRRNILHKFETHMLKNAAERKKNE